MPNANLFRGAASKRKNGGIIIVTVLCAGLSGRGERFLLMVCLIFGNVGREWVNVLALRSFSVEAFL